MAMVGSHSHGLVRLRGGGALSRYYAPRGRAGAERDVLLAEGVELTRKGFMDVLAKYGVEPVDPVGEPFDPETAQAMSMVEQPDVEPNSVVAVMQKGYLLNGRLLRPAMVMVSKAPSDA